MGRSLAIVQGFVPISEASCPVILGIILPFCHPLSSAEMSFRQHLDLITVDLFVQGPDRKRYNKCNVNKCTVLTVIRQIPFSTLCVTGSFPVATFKGLQNPACDLKAFGHQPKSIHGPDVPERAG